MHFACYQFTEEPKGFFVKKDTLFRVDLQLSPGVAEQQTE